jgi:catechol 2,3-dioxygenase-like lactoylglutathione lyase family enzyme
VPVSSVVFALKSCCVAIFYRLQAGAAGDIMMLPAPAYHRNDPMLSHVFIGVTDFDRALRFYSPIMEALKLTLKFVEENKPWAGWVAANAPRPLFLIGKPFDGNVASPGNGQMVALLAPDRDTVDQCHAIALAHGGECDGPPGLRPQYHANYYGAYFRDPDGNKISVCCHEPGQAWGSSAWQQSD